MSPDMMMSGGMHMMHGMMMDTAQMSAMDHPGMMDGDMHGKMHGAMHDPAGGSHSVASHGDACGYCSLLAHMPAVTGVETPFAVTVWSIQHRVATRFESVRRAEPLTFAQARAPPVSS